MIWTDYDDAMRRFLLLVSFFAIAACPHPAVAEPIAVLDLPGSGTDPEKIDYQALPTLHGTHAVVHPASIGPYGESFEGSVDIHHFRLQLHNYLAHHDGKFWCLWSDGPRVEDEPTQELKFSTSLDGMTWTPAKSVTGKPEAPYAYIARGLWVRDGELLALAAHYKGKGAFGTDKELKLAAFAWNDEAEKWEFRETVHDNAINNFPPQRLASGDWIMTRRDARFNVSVLIGGKKSLSDWQSFPVVGIGEVKGFRPDEPIFWPLEDGALFGLYRDNSGSRRLFHSVSQDGGKTWGVPEMTNFPNATSKLFSLKTSRGYRVLILNANPKIGRRELHLAVSKDGQRFTRLARLDIPSSPALTENLAHRQKKFEEGIASLQYPHAIEHEGALYIALSRLKVQTEVFRVSLEQIDDILD